MGEGTTTTTPYHEQSTLSDRQEMVLFAVQRCTAAASCLSAMVMASQAWQMRHKVYHRFILGISFHLFCFSCWHLVGHLAVPAEGSPGTVVSCSFQGFGLQTHGLGASLYYVFLSLYSYLAVRHNFEPKAYLWVEKWIHLIVNLIPLTTALFL